MNGWPTDDRASVPTSTRKGRAEDKKRGNVSLHYPALDSGLVNAARLHGDNGRWTWQTLVGDKSTYKHSAVRSSKLASSPFRSVPSRLSQATKTRNSEEDAYFLRTHVPDLDIAVEAIKEHVLEGTAVEGNTTFDPYDGSIIEPILIEGSPSLAFPSGELGTDLNICPIISSEQSGISVEASVVDIEFPTPIRQIRFAPSTASCSLSAHTVVRTFGKAYIFKNELVSKRLRLTEIASFARQDFQSRLAMDVLLQHSPLNAIFINDQGMISQWDLYEGRKLVTDVAAPFSESLNPTSVPFWRLAETDHPSTILRASDTLVQSLDLRARGVVSDVFTARRPRETITFTDCLRSNRACSLVTTEELMLVDVRSPRKPLLGIAHGRKYDRSLRLGSWSSGDSTFTFLTSLKNGFISIYDITRAPDEPLRVNSRPYSLPTFQGLHMPHLGHAIAQHAQNSDALLFQMLYNGAIRCSWLCSSLTPSPYEPGLRPSTRTPSTMHPMFFSARECLDVNFSSIYNDISQWDESKGADALSGILNENQEPSLEGETQQKCVFIAFDFTLRSGENAVSRPRSDFLLMETADLRTTEITTHCSESFNLPRILQSLDPIGADTDTSYELLYDTRTSLGLTTAMTRSAAQLTADMGLATKIFLPSMAIENNDATAIDNIMLHATQALSLTDKPAPISFGFLSPSTDEDEDTLVHDDDNTYESNNLTSIGTQLLLGEWTIGTDPANYRYTDSYRYTAVEGPTARSEIESQPLQSTARNTVSREVYGVQSQPVNTLPTTVGKITASVEPATSTQVLPGLFGGRQVIAKKAVKKRVGGF